MEGIKDAGISSDKVNIWIEFTSGIRGGLILSQKETENGLRSTVSSVAGGSVPPLSAGTGNSAVNTQNSCNQVANAGGEASDSATVRNCRVHIWDPFWGNDSLPVIEANPYYKIFNNTNGMLDVNAHFGDHANVSFLRTLTDYGTVIIETLQWKSNVGPVFATGTEFLPDHLANEEIMLEILLGSLELWTSMKNEIYYAFTPLFIYGLDGNFKNSIVYVHAYDSSTLAEAFLKKGVHTFFGYMGNPDDIYAGETLFTSMVKDGMDTGEAYAALPSRSEGGSLFLKYSSSTTEIGYKGNVFPVWSEIDFPAEAQYPLLRGYNNGTDLHWLEYHVKMTETARQLIYTSIMSYQKASEAEKRFNSYVTMPSRIPRNI